MLRDASFTPGGFSVGVVHARSEADVAQVLRTSDAVLPVGAQSSVTGGGTPMGETLLSLRHLRSLQVEPGQVQVGAGVTLAELQAALAVEEYLPPVPTYDGAQVGGVVSTNASGASTFKYGSVRQWVQGLTVVLASGEVLDLERGEYQAHADGYFELLHTSGQVMRVPVPRYVMPDVPKRSAGYHAAPGMDLVNLFIGSEGTLGVITQATLRTRSPLPPVATLLIPCPDESSALALTAILRRAAQRAWTGHAASPDVRAVEYLDRRCLGLLREEGADRSCGVPLHPDDGALLIVQVELPPGDLSWLELLDGDPARHPLPALVQLLAGADRLERTELALPGDRRAAQLLALREAVPASINRRFARAQLGTDPGISKVGADMVVPFARLPEAMTLYRKAFEQAGVDYAIWGHASDGNMHPNMLPGTLDDVRRARAALLELGQTITDLGGCPLAEHGVGRSAVKQALLRQLYGEQGAAEMRDVKRAVDPDGVLSPGVLFGA